MCCISSQAGEAAEGDQRHSTMAKIKSPQIAGFLFSGKRLSLCAWAIFLRALAILFAFLRFVTGMLPRSIIMRDILLTRLSIWMLMAMMLQLLDL